MILNEFILKNEKLSSQMKAFSNEIDKLEQLRSLFLKNSDQNCGLNPNLSTALTRKLKRAKEQFTMLNKAYDENAHQNADKNTAAFIAEAIEEIKEIQDIFINLRYINSH